MSICELSFQSQTPLQSVPYQEHQLRFKIAIAPEQLSSELGKLASRLSRQTRTPIVANSGQCSLLSPRSLRGDSTFEILSVSSVDLSSQSYHRQLKQVLNQSLVRYFRSCRRRVDAYSKKAFLDTAQVSAEIEAQRFLQWDIRIGSDNSLFLSIDFSNEYHSLQPLAPQALSTLSPDQPLVHTYDGGTCRYVEPAGFTVSEPRTKLGNLSLLEYHRQQGKVSPSVLDAIPQDTPAIRVNYGSKGQDKIYGHIPNLLRKTFTKDDVDPQRFNDQVWSIHQRFQTAIQEIQALNQRGGLLLSNQKITFKTFPYSPELQVDLAQQRSNNLDFGQGTFCSYPAKALNRRRLLAKPTQISTVVFYPENAKQSKVTAWCESFASFVNEFEIQLQLQEYRTYTQGDTLSIQRSCRNADKFDLALLFVPDQERFENSRQHDPYPIFKRELVKIMLPSQAIESSTFRDGFSNYQRGTIRPKFNQSIGYNLLLGILGKLGYSAWQLKGIPGEAQAFLGLDVGRKNGVAVGVAAFIVSPQGQVIGWFPAHFQAHRETFDRSALRNILFSLVNLYEEKQETPLRHLVVHRDGRFQANELELFDELLPELKQAGIEKFDAVEVLKSDYTRMGEWQSQAQQWENPRRGWMFPIGEHEVALMTTGKTEIKGGTNFVPRPLRVRRRRGETSPGFLASQVYWLSEMHIGSTSTVRLPITTYYPDLAAEYALEGLLPSGLQKGCHLPL